MIYLLPMGAFALMISLSWLAGSGFGGIWRRVHRFVNETSSSTERHARIALVLFLCLASGYHIWLLGNILFASSSSCTQFPTKKSVPFLRFTLGNDAVSREQRRSSDLGGTSKTPKRLTRKERLLQRRQRVTANDFITGRGRGFLFVADGTDLIRSLTAAKVLRTYAAFAGGAGSGGHVGTSSSRVSITLLTDDFGVRSFHPPALEGLTVARGAARNQGAGSKQSPNRRPRSRRSAPHAATAHPRQASSVFSSVPRNATLPPLFDPFDHVWDIRWIIAQGKAWKRRHPASYGETGGSGGGAAASEDIRTTLSEQEGIDDDDDDDGDLDDEDKNNNNGEGRRAIATHSSASPSSSSLSLSSSSSSSSSSTPHEPHQLVSWTSLRLYALAHLSPYEETVFVGPDTLLCSPLVFGLFDLLRRYPLVATPPAHTVGSGGGGGGSGAAAQFFRAHHGGEPGGAVAEAAAAAAAAALGAAGNPSGGGFALSKKEGLEAVEDNEEVGEDAGSFLGSEPGEDASSSSLLYPRASNDDDKDSNDDGGDGGGSIDRRHDLSLDLAPGATPKLSKGTGVPNVLRPLGLGLVAYKQSDAARACFRRLLALHLAAADEQRDQASRLIQRALDSGHPQAATAAVDDGSMFAHAAFLTPHLALYVLPQDWNCRAESLLPGHAFRGGANSRECLAFHAPPSARSHPTAAEALKVSGETTTTSPLQLTQPSADEDDDEDDEDDDGKKRGPGEEHRSCPPTAPQAGSARAHPLVPCSRTPFVWANLDLHGWLS